MLIAAIKLIAIFVVAALNHRRGLAASWAGYLLVALCACGYADHYLAGPVDGPFIDMVSDGLASVACAALWRAAEGEDRPRLWLIPLAILLFLQVIDHEQAYRGALDTKAMTQSLGWLKTLQIALVAGGPGLHWSRVYANAIDVFLRSRSGALAALDHLCDPGGVDHHRYRRRRAAAQRRQASR